MSCKVGKLTLAKMPPKKEPTTGHHGAVKPSPYTTPALSHWLGTTSAAHTCTVRAAAMCNYDGVLPTFVINAATSPHLARCSSGSPGHRTARFSLCLVSMATARRNHCARESLGGKKQEEKKRYKGLYIIYSLSTSSLANWQISQGRQEWMEKVFNIAVILGRSINTTYWSKIDITKTVFFWIHLLWHKWSIPLFFMNR